MTIQQMLGLATACVVALLTFLIGTEANGTDIPDVLMIVLGAIGAVLGAANAFLSSADNMAKQLWKNNSDAAMRHAPPGMFMHAARTPVVPDNKY